MYSLYQLFETSLDFPIDRPTRILLVVLSASDGGGLGAFCAESEIQIFVFYKDKLPRLERGGRSLEAERIRSAFTSTLGFRGARGGVGRFALEGIIMAEQNSNFEPDVRSNQNKSSQANSLTGRRAVSFMHDVTVLLRSLQNSGNQVLRGIFDALKTLSLVQSFSEKVVRLK